MADLEALVYYSTRFSRLRVDRAHGIAPHKPILLLSVIQLINTRSIKENRIYLSSELIDTFLRAWGYLGSELHNPDISRPFFHLRGDKFWHLVPNRGFRKVITSKIKLKNFHEVQQAVKYAYVDDLLFELLQDPTSKNNLMTILKHRWFGNKIDQCNQFLALEQDEDLAASVKKTTRVMR